MQRGPDGTFRVRGGCEQHGADADRAGGAHAGDTVVIASGLKGGETAWSPMDRRNCRPACRWLRKRRPGKKGSPERTATLDRTSHEYFAAVHSAADRDVAADGGTAAGGHRGVSAVADFRVAAGRLSHHSDCYVLSRRQSGRHGIFDHRAAGAAVRAAARPEPDDVEQLVRQLRSSRCSSPWKKTSMLPSRKCRRPSMRRERSCLRICRPRRSTARSIRRMRRF